MSARIVAAGRAIGLYAAGSLAAGVVGFLALPFFTRIFTPDDFGVIGLFTAAVGLLAPAISLGGYVFLLYDTATEMRSGVVAATIAIASMGALVAIALGFTAVAASDLQPDLVLLAVVTAWANVWILVRLHAFQAADRPRDYFLLSVIPPLGAFAGTIALALAIDGWASRVWALALIALCTAAGCALSLRRAGLLVWSQGRRRLGDVTRFGAPLVVHTASIWVVGFTDRFIVAELEGLSAAGIYTVAYAVGLGVSSAHDGVSRYFSSRLATWVQTAGGRDTAAKFAYAYAFVSILTIPLLIPVALYGLRWLTPAAFEGGTELLVWLIPAQTLAGVVRVFSAYLYIEKRTRHRALMSGFEAVTNLLLTWYLVASFGVVGAAAATFLTYALSLTGSFILARRGETLQPASLVIRRWRGE